MAKRLIPAIILYAVALVFAAFAAWSIVTFYDVVDEAVAENRLVVAKKKFDVASFYMSGGQHFATALLLAAAGLIIQRLPSAEKPAKPKKAKTKMLDIWNEEDAEYEEDEFGESEPEEAPTEVEPEGELTPEVEPEGELTPEVEPAPEKEPAPKVEPAPEKEPNETATVSIKDMFK